MSDTKDNSISNHIFLFPFIWKRENNVNSDNIEDEREKYIAKLTSKSTGWERNPFTEFKTVNDFNEYQYFYPFVRDVMYDNGKDDSLVKHLTYESAKGGTYTIQLSDDYVNETKKSYADVQTKYTLDILKIELNLYSTGVGVLSYHLENFNHKSKEDVLIINQFGRRIYPPFLGEDDILKKTFELELPKEISLNIGDKSLKGSFSDNYGKIENIKEYVDEGIKLPDFVLGLIDCGGDYKITPLLDDRMYVVCWYGAKQELLCDLSRNNEKNYLLSDFWMKYVFVNSNEKSYWNKKKQNTYLEKHTNDRWVDYKYEGNSYPTLYGISRYSFTSLSNNPSDYSFSKVIKSYVVNHYFKLFELSIVQRASLINFGMKASDISKKILINNEKDHEEFRHEIKNLYVRYMRFLNKYCFNEITPQDQGIELYDLVQKTMRIPSQTTSLDNEIKELHGYIATIDGKIQSKEANRLSRLATLFLLPSFLASVLPLLPEKYLQFHPKSDLLIFFIPIVSFAYFYIKFNCFEKPFKNK